MRKNQQNGGSSNSNVNRKLFGFFGSSSSSASSPTLRSGRDQHDAAYSESHNRRHSSLFGSNRFTVIPENANISPSSSSNSLLRTQSSNIRKTRSSLSLVTNGDVVRTSSNSATPNTERFSWSNHAKTFSGRIMTRQSPKSQHRATFSLDEESATASHSYHLQNNTPDANVLTAHRSSSVSSRTSATTPSTILTTSQGKPLVYPALLSKVSELFKERIPTGIRTKFELEYQDAFTGAEAVDMIINILRSRDRNLALLLGRALDAQKFFHDVTYDNRLRDSHNEVYRFNEDDNNSTAKVIHAVNGVFTLLTDCYSPTCTRERLCYSITCPRRLEQQARLNMKPQEVLKRNESKLSVHDTEDDETVDRGQELWIHTVPREVSGSLSEREKKRQEVICELIYTERDFVKDLEYIRDFWITPLSTLNIIPEYRRENFIKMVFGLVMDVHKVNVALAEAFSSRQQESMIVKEIGDVILEHAKNFEPFVEYGAHQAYAKYEIDKEKSRNPIFAKFISETERKKESRKLEINGYLTKPTTRLARYPLFIDAILKVSGEDSNMGNSSPDYSKEREHLSQARLMIRQFLTKVNTESGKAETRLQLQQINNTLSFRNVQEKFFYGEVLLNLESEERQLIFKGMFKKRNQDKDNHGDVQCYLFDHAILFARAKIVNKKEQLKVQKRVCFMVMELCECVWVLT